MVPHLSLSKKLNTNNKMCLIYIYIYIYIYTHTHTQILWGTYFVIIASIFFFFTALRNWIRFDFNNGSIHIYRVSQEECEILREGVPYVKVYRYNPKHLCPNLNGYGDNDQRSLKL